MKYKLSYLRWAPFAEENAEPAGALPNYGSAMTLGEVSSADDAPVFNSAKGYGDNALKRYVSEFKEVPINVEVLDFATAVFAAILGAKIQTMGTVSVIRHNKNDNAPYGGLGFVFGDMLDGNVVAYRGLFFPKVKAAMQGRTYTTKSENITLSGEKMQFLGAACNSGDWALQTDFLETEEEAMAWVDAMLTGNAQEADSSTTEDETTSHTRSPAVLTAGLHRGETCKPLNLSMKGRNGICALTARPCLTFLKNMDSRRRCWNQSKGTVRRTSMRCAGI